jgi:recombinational DNA repair protein (RecF pathway)
MAETKETPGESTASWAFREPGFFGSVKHLTHCARCGLPLPPGRGLRRVRMLYKPMHFICNECFEQLPE